MTLLLPSLQAERIRTSIVDYLSTTFALTDAQPRRALADFLEDSEQGVFVGPFVRLRLPYLAASARSGVADQPLDWDPGLVPYRHQEDAYRRLTTKNGHRPQPTIITTGTGSGKTEAFLHPILDHVLRARAAGVTGLMQQQALSSMIAELGGDPSTVAGSLEQAAPTVRVLNPATEDQEGFQARYAVFMASSMMLYLVILMGGQFIAMGVVEEKSSRIIEILLACVRPTSLLAGKVLGTGASLILCFGLVGTAGAVTAQITGIMPDVDIDLNATLVVTLVWMVVGYAIFSVLFGAAGALVSRQEDVAGAVMPLTALCVLPFMVSLAMFMGDPKQLIWKVLSYIPPLSPYLMPARLVSGVSNWVEQGVALIIALAALPLLVRVSATIYTRAVTRTGSRVPLKEVLGRRAR